MARRYVSVQQAPASTVLNRYDDPNTAYLPNVYKDAAANAYQAAASQYNNSFTARHPVASKALSALAGLAVGGPAGAFIGPLALGKAEDNRKASIVAGYQNAINTLNAQQKDLLPTQQSYGNTAGLKTTLANQGIESPIPEGAPVSDEAYKNLLNAGTANQTLDNATARIQNAQANAFGAYGGFNNNQQQAQPQNQNLPQLQVPIDESNPLSGNINNTPLMPYTYMDPSAVTSTINQIGSVTNQSPNDYATLQKLHPEIAKLVAERQNQQSQASANNALSGYRQAQTKTEAYKPQLLKAQANSANSTAAFNRRRYSGGPSGNGSNNPLVNLGRTQEILQRQKQAIVSQMLQNGFLDKKTGLLKPPTPEGEWGGVFGLGAHGDNKAKVDQYNALQTQLNSIDSQLTGGAAPQQVYPTKPGNQFGVTTHNTSAGPVKY